MISSWCRLPIRPGLAPAALFLGGCSGSAAPLVPIAGAYFPSWLICVAAGVIGAVLVRLIFIRIGIDEGLPLRLFVYCGVAAIIGIALALTVFGR